MTAQDKTIQTEAGGAIIPPAISHGWFYVPYAAFGSLHAVEHEKTALTFMPKFAEDDDEPIRMFRDLPSRGFLGVPRAYGMRRFPWLAVDDRRVMGDIIEPSPRRPDPNHPRVKDPVQQAKFMDDLHRAALTYGSYVAMASTGTGKTVCALDLTQRIQRRTLIMVPLERLMDQWLEEIKDKLGLPEERIGIVQGPVCQWEGKDIVVGMMQSLAQRQTYPRAFYEAFGMTVIDECHRIGSQVLSRVVPLFPAHFRLAMSATPDRVDGGERVVYWHVGPIGVQSQAVALECVVYVKRFKSSIPLTGKHPQSRAKCFTRDPERNRMIVDLILRNYRIGRKILVIGKFIDHLQAIMEACARQGVPLSAMGQYTGQHAVRATVMTENGPRTRTVKRVKVPKQEYDRIKAECHIIFATYGVFKEGIDVPHLDCGIDVLPQSAATQVIGRIRRPMEGKPQPYWITILDEDCGFAQGMYQKRLKDYRDTGCRVIDNRKL